MGSAADVDPVADADTVAETGTAVGTAAVDLVAQQRHRYRLRYHGNSPEQGRRRPEGILVHLRQTRNHGFEQDQTHLDRSLDIAAEPFERALDLDELPVAVGQSHE